MGGGTGIPGGPGRDQLFHLISAANTGIVNLYAKLGFHYDKTLFGFRKYL